MPRNRDALCRGRRVGMTIIELLVAVMLLGLLMLTGVALVDGLTDASQRLVAAQRQADRLAVSQRLLRAVALDADPGVAPGALFQGDSTHLRFGSWCPTPRGTREACLVQVRIDSSAWLAIPTLTLRIESAARPKRLLYLADARAGGRWEPAWAESQSPPVAIGIVHADATRLDTLLLRVGVRQ